MGSRAVNWLLAAGAIAVSWVAGIGLWGVPERGFSAFLPFFHWAFIVAIGVPAMAIAALADGGTVDRSRAWRITGMVIWVTAIVLLMWPTSFVHFGGFCIDPTDVCVIRWPGRVAGLLLALGLLVSGWLGAVAIDRWPRSRRGVSAAEPPSLN
jgi:hypothetical protein